MVTNNESPGSRIATAKGAMLVDPAKLGRPADAGAETIFDLNYWEARGEIAAASRGRGATWFISSQRNEWALRHYRRGGLITPLLSADRYLWVGESGVRAFAEWRLLATLRARGLPVPEPIAARYERDGRTYRCDLIMRRILAVDPLSVVLAAGPLDSRGWRAIGATIARFHAAGVDHADLNAHNILLGKGEVSLVDFDRGRVRPEGSWRQANLRRLRRSLRKIAAGLPPGRYSPTEWDALVAGYRHAHAL
jgi:3-deoxy-D-manno-octulosonic acid kinase